MTGPSHDDPLSLFISYSRRDLKIADKLVVALEAAGFKVLIDRRDLPYGEEWQRELADFIRSADTAIWLISPDSLASKWCNWEAGEVSRMNKRLVTIRIREFDSTGLPETLGKIHILPADRIFSIEQDLDKLVTTINTDRSW